MIKILKRNKIFAELCEDSDIVSYLNTISSDYKTLIPSLRFHLMQFDEYKSVDFRTHLNSFHPTTSTRSKLYWLKRGFNRTEAKLKVFELQSRSGKKAIYKHENSPRRIEYYLKTMDESNAMIALSKFQRRNSKRTTEFWTSRGYSESEAVINVAKFQDNSKFIDYDKRLIPSNVEYWINKNYSLIDAKLKVSEHQCTFSKEIAIAKLGIIEGTKKLEAVAELKRNTFFARPIEEQYEITERRTSNNIGSWKGNQFCLNESAKTRSAIIYYFKFTDNEVNYWKIGITTNNFNSRFNYTMRKRFNIRDVIFKSYSLGECFIKEQSILKNHVSHRIKTTLTTESFNKDINNGDLL